jgi:5-methylcytosine-specific restriction endonuclease McrA
MPDCPTPERGRGGVLIADHIEPRREGGPDELWNLRTLCSFCDGRRHGRRSRLRAGLWRERFASARSRVRATFASGFCRRKSSRLSFGRDCQ